MTQKNLPIEIMVWSSDFPITWTGTWATTRYQPDAVAYVPKAYAEKLKAAAIFGLEMAKANDLPNTAEAIQKALDSAIEGDV